MYIFRLFIAMHFISAVLIPFFMDWGKISFFQIMILQSWFILWAFLLEIPTGAVADFWGRKVSLAMGSIFNIAAILIYISKPDFFIFLAGEFLWAFAIALYSGADEALVYDSLKEIKKEEESKKILGRLNSFDMLALIVAAPVGSLMAARFGLRAPTLFMTVPFLLAFFIALTIKEPKTEKKIESVRYLQTLTDGVKYFYNHKILKILALDAATINIFVFLLIWIYQLVLKQLNMPLKYFGIVNALICLAQIVVMSNFGRFEKIFGSKKKFLFFSAIIPGIGFVLLGLNSLIILAVILMIIITGFGLSRYVLISNYAQKHIESHNRATVLSSVSMLRKFGLAIMYPIAGKMVEWSLNSSLILIGIAIILFSFFSIFKVKESYLID
jgi:MFS family permease